MWLIEILINTYLGILDRMSAFYQLISAMRRSFLLFLVLFFSVTGSHAVAADEDIVRSTVSQAEELQLAQHEIWLALLHYKQETVLRRFISQADDERFFLDEQGKFDPHAELVASIEAFLREPESSHARR